MNLKKFAFVAAGAIASLNSVTAEDDDSATFFDSFIFSIGQMSEVFGDSFGTVLNGVADIVDDVAENGFSIGAIIDGISEIAINVVAEVVTAVTNIAFSLLSGQISELIQGALGGFFPFEILDLFGSESELLKEDVTTAECPTASDVNYTKTEMSLEGPEKAEISELVFIENTYEDGNFEALIDVKFKDFSAVVTTTGELEGMNCNGGDNPVYTVITSVTEITMGGRFELKATIVDDTNFTAESLIMRSVTYEGVQDVVATDYPDSDDDDVKNALEAKFQEIILDDYFSVFEDSVENVTLINELIVDNEILPFNYELPFSWPF